MKDICAAPVAVIRLKNNNDYIFIGMYSEGTDSIVDFEGNKIDDIKDHDLLVTFNTNFYLTCELGDSIIFEEKNEVN